MSLNPIQFGKDVLDQYGRYLLTTFSLSDSRLSDQLKSGLAYGPGSGDRLAKGPYVYLNRPFVHGPEFEDLLAEKELGLHRALATLFRFKALYKHQERALRAAAKGKHVLLATGTGSGKTEGFLLPILDHCLKLRDERAEDGVVAVLIYPMNALVNDQIERLRKLLAGSKITFARFTGETPMTDTSTPRLEEPREYTRQEIAQAERQHKELPLPWEECASRAEILERRPRLLLTNYAQLEYLLLRDRDLSLFRSAPLRFFVLDEVHTYTGALGSQVACLLRRLRSVARKNAEDVICIGSSATVTERETTGAEAQLRSFGARLFGVPEGTIEVVREEYQRPRPPADRYVPPAPTDPVALLGRILGAVRGLLVAEEVHEVPDEVLRLAEELCGQQAPFGSGSLERLWDLLAPNRLVETLQEVFVRPVTLDEVLPRLQPLADRRNRTPTELQAEILSYLTLGALARRDDEPLLRPKLHFFVQGLSGLWLRWHGTAPEPEPQLLFSDKSPGSELAFPLSFCRACGQPYVHLHPAEPEAVANGGNGFQRLAGLGPQIPEGADEDDQGLLLTDRLITGDEEGNREDEERYLCRFCGGLHEKPAPHCLGPKCRQLGPLVKVLIWKLPIFSCPACGARSTERSPIVTLVRSTEVNDVMILGQTMLSSMPEPDLRKVLIFADSRQDAAFQAGWMDGRSRRFRLRHMIYQVLEHKPGRRWYFKDLADQVAEIATAEGLIPSKGQRREQELERLQWMLIEEFFAASERQRRNSLEQLGLARMDYDGAELASMGDLADSWAKRLKTTPQAVVDTVGSLLDVFRLRHAVSHPMLQRLWSDRDREVRDGVVTIQQHFRPQLVVAGPTGANQKSYTISLRSKTRSTTAERLISAAFEGCSGEQVRHFLDDVLEWMAARGLLVPARIKVRRHGKLEDLAKITAGYQVNLENVQISYTTERFVCRHCGKAAGRILPSGRCRSYRCEGSVSLEPRDAEHFDVVQYTQREFVPLLSREHSAQVPKEDRLKAEREFKQTNGGVNCLVATPTLELGVDIGPLEMVLLRNVPPSPANYAQRSGRAGRRHRIGAVFSYCRSLQHDQYFYTQPPAMISGEVRVPGFSMRNEPLVRQHVFSAVLTELRGKSEATEILAATFPTYIWNYFGYRDDEDREFYHPGLPDLSAFRDLIEEHTEGLITNLNETFTAQWPAEDAWVVSDEALRRMVSEVPLELERVIATLQAEVNNYRRILREYRQREDQNEHLGYEDTMRRNSYNAALRRLWAQTQDNYSISYLARRGFFPGYALVKDSVRAQSVDPPLDLSRPLVVALRELAPASLIYANRCQFRMTGLEIYRMKAQDPQFRPESLEQAMVLDRALDRIVPPDQATEGGEKPGIGFRSLQMIDVALEGLGSISDQEEYRHRRAYYQYALQLPEHRGGHQGRVGMIPYQYFREGNLRTVNLGAKKRGPLGEREIGFPICLVCGAVRSPLASDAEIENFKEHHKKFCRRSMGWYALHVDVRSDLLVLGPFSVEHGAINAIEALRIGCRRVLEMGEVELETEQLSDKHGQSLGVLFDPLPGGSGFLPLTMEHWERIIDSARDVLNACQCERSCYRCLLHFRNQQHHGVLDRHLALHALSEMDGVFEKQHTLSPSFVQEKDHSSETESPKEDRFLAILKDKKFPLPPEAQYRLDLGGGSVTVADFAYPDQKVLIFIDGLSDRIHGNPEQQRKDRILRTKAQLKGWIVRTISGEGLSDQRMVADFLDDLSLLLGMEA